MPDFLPPDDEQELTQVPPSALAALNSSEHEAMVRVANLRDNRRKIADFENRLMSYANHSQEIALSMFYSLPRGGKMVLGPSIRFAELVGPCWRNCAVAARVVGDTENTVVGQGVYIDFEWNVRNVTEAPRRIVDKDGRRYNSDMVLMTSNVAMSIARRNAVLRGGVPQALWEPSYAQAQLTAVGKANSHTQRVADAMEFLHKMGLTEWQILNAVGVPSVKELETEHLLTLRVLCQEIKKGDKTIEQVFGSQFDKEIDSLFVALKMNTTQQTMLRNSHLGRASDLLTHLRGRVGTPAASKPAPPVTQQEPAQQATPAPAAKTTEPVPAEKASPITVEETVAQKSTPEWNAKNPIETKTYSDGTTATGVGPLPDLSPAQQAAMEGEPINAAPAVTWDEMAEGHEENLDAEPPDDQGPGRVVSLPADEQDQPARGSQHRDPEAAQPASRRGRPTKAEQAARRAAEQGNLIEQPLSEAEARKQAEDVIQQTDQFSF